MKLSNNYVPIFKQNNELPTYHFGEISMNVYMVDFYIKTALDSGLGA